MVVVFAFYLLISPGNKLSLAFSLSISPLGLNFNLYTYFAVNGNFSFREICRLPYIIVVQSINFTLHCLNPTFIFCSFSVVKGLPHSQNIVDIVDIVVSETTLLLDSFNSSTSCVCIACGVPSSWYLIDIILQS